MTCAATWVTASGITGFTLPGMIDDPGWRSGMKISDNPARGPLPIHRRSLAIFTSATAVVRRWPDASTSESRADWAAKWSRASLKGSCMSEASRAMTPFAKVFGALSPVPTAVPPKGSSPMRGKASRSRSTDCST